MYDDLHRLYVEWSERTGQTSIDAFSSEVYKKTGVLLSDILTDSEREQLLQGPFDGDEALLEGLDSGP